MEKKIDGELSCNNCSEKTRCKQQQKANKQRIDAILSYIIASEDNETYIAELKNEIPAITRCDVVLEKQLKRLEKENEELKIYIESNKQEVEQAEDVVMQNAQLLLKLEKIRDCIKNYVCDEECNYDWTKPCTDYDCRYNNILQIIEEE